MDGAEPSRRMEVAKLVVLMFLVGLLPLSATAADESDIDWTQCAKEMKQFNCSGSDEEIFECLEQHEDQFSEACEEQHKKGDALYEKDDDDDDE